MAITGKKHSIRKVIFQDPVFSLLDHDILTSLGYTVLPDSEAFSKIDSQTFVFAPHLEFGAYATALEGAVPALCIGNDINEYLNAWVVLFSLPHIEES